MLTNTKESYGFISKIFHWIIGFSVIGLITVGFIMSSMEKSPEKFELYGMHKAFGVFVLFLVMLRILWRITNTTVQSVEGVPQMLQFFAKAGHLFLYFFMLVMPISGILMSRFGGYPISVFGLFTIPPTSEKNSELAGIFYTIHGYAAWFFVFLISIHTIAALYHHFIRKDRTLIRMIK